MILKVRNASFGYRPPEMILRDITFEAHPGELIAVLGPNGAGKTTLLRCILGSLKWTGGESTIDGLDIRRSDSRKLRQKLAYVPQARGLVSALSAGDMILLGRTGRMGTFSVPTQEDRDFVMSAAEQLHICHLLDKPCTQISGGELQMVLIARALAAEPELMILDEPESNLDFRNQLIMLDALSGLASRGICCLFNTHYPEHALTRADKTLVLEKGGGSIFGETSRILTKENIARIFGVRTLIGEVETGERTYQSVFPIGILHENDAVPEAEENEEVIAVVSMIFSEEDLSGPVNRILHEFGPFIIGRMGIPYHQAGLSIINITLDAPRSEVNALTHRLTLLSGLSVKTTVSAKNTEKEPA